MTRNKSNLLQILFDPIYHLFLVHQHDVKSFHVLSNFFLLPQDR